MFVVDFRFDSLTGVPSAQRTVAFEKACVLFNLGALYTQIGARQERCTGDGLDASVDNFLRAASIFRFIVDNFTNAPSMDLAPQVLEALILLMIVRSSTFHPLFHLLATRLCFLSTLFYSIRERSFHRQLIQATRWTWRVSLWVQFNQIIPQFEFTAIPLEIRLVLNSNGSLEFCQNDNNNKKKRMLNVVDVLFSFLNKKNQSYPLLRVHFWKIIPSNFNL